MAFNFEAFLGGAATGLSDFADETSRKKEKKEMQRRQHMRL